LAASQFNAGSTAQSASCYYDEFKIAHPDEVTDKEMGGLGEEESEGSQAEEEDLAATSRPSAVNAMLSGGLYEDLLEQVDEVDGIENEEYARLKYVPDNAESCDARDVAVIGFWKLTDDSVFRCYHFFYVPNPMMREVKDIEGTDLQQVLYTGVAPEPQVPGDIFFFYKDEDGWLNHAIINLGLNEQAGDEAPADEPEVPITSQQVEANCTTEKIARNSILEHYIFDLNTRKLVNEDEKEKEQDQMPNPNMVKMNGDNHIVFTAYLREKYSS